MIYFQYTEAALDMCSYKKMFWKYVVNLQKNTRAEVLFYTSALVSSCKFVPYFKNNFF